MVINLRTPRKTAFMAILFAVSAFTLVGKLLMPTPIQIIIQGEDPIVVGQILSYTGVDIVVISISAVVLGITVFYLLIYGFETSSVISAGMRVNSSELDVKFVLRLLDGDARTVFAAIVEAGGEILQRDLPIQTNFSKVKITRTLDYLEGKGLIIRKRHGMTNKVIITKGNAPE